MSKKEFGVTAVTLGLAVLVFILLPFQTVSTPYSAIDSGLRMNPRIFPIFSAGLMGILSAVHLISLVRVGIAGKQSNGSFFLEEDQEGRGGGWIVTLACCIMILYVIIMPFIGFLLDTVILCTLLAIYLKSKWWQILISGVAIPIALYYLFQLVYVTMPAGILG